MSIQSNSPVYFRTLPVDCRNFLALTAAKLSCVCVVAQKQVKQIIATIRREMYGCAPPMLMLFHIAAAVHFGINVPVNLRVSSG